MNLELNVVRFENEDVIATSACTEPKAYVVFNRNFVKTETDYYRYDLNNGKYMKFGDSFSESGLADNSLKNVVVHTTNWGDAVVCDKEHPGINLHQ